MQPIASEDCNDRINRALTSSPRRLYRVQGSEEEHSTTVPVQFTDEMNRVHEPSFSLCRHRADSAHGCAFGREQGDLIPLMEGPGALGYFHPLRPRFPASKQIVESRKNAALC